VAFRFLKGCAKLISVYQVDSSLKMMGFGGGWLGTASPTCAAHAFALREVAFRFLQRCAKLISVYQVDSSLKMMGFGGGWLGTASPTCAGHALARREEGTGPL
jgi:kynureninase